MRRAPKRPGMYVPAEHAEFYHANGYEVVDDLSPNQVLVIPRSQDDARRAEPRDGPP